ncbi:hypothetical protein [Streptomyces griseorubiginosus]|uniref:hypothetical protein n=1 Tax=Streptomyces griseorubiginosus TaxID=67304 RepID=UPI001AD62EE7|nr:hypothetical protein [Streptomyces griseorubiginosus]MBO4258940.1 hypothetical protein [Streptomyces griseorubiginosus]
MSGAGTCSAAADPEEPIRITGVVWPGLWMGEAHRRRHRPTVDRSMGWGHSSQWRTDIRVDLRTENGVNAAELGGTPGWDPFDGRLSTSAA